jgi:hypothetical protein
MNAMRITVQKVPDGLGPDAWEAYVALDDVHCAIKVTGRGESRDHARKALRSSLLAVAREFNDVVGELSR